MRADRPKSEHHETKGTVERTVGRSEPKSGSSESFSCRNRPRLKPYCLGVVVAERQAMVGNGDGGDSDGLG